MHKKNRSKIAFSKKMIAYVLFMCSFFIAFICYEMHRLEDLSAVAYIGTGIIGLMATSVGFYTWRAKQSDMYDLAKTKALEEKEMGVSIDVKDFKDDINQDQEEYY